MASNTPVCENELRRYLLSNDNVDANNNNSEGLDFDSLCPNCILRQDVVPYGPPRPVSPTLIGLLTFCRKSHRNMARIKDSDRNLEFAKERLKNDVIDSTKEKTDSKSREDVARKCEDKLSASQEVCVEHKMENLKISGE